MAEIIESGVWDLIGAARPSIADPFLPRKIERGPRRRDPRVHRLQHLHLEGRRAAATSAARRTRPPARSTAAAGIRSASSRRTTPTATCSWSAPGRRGMECAIVLGKRGFDARAAGRRRAARSAGSRAGCRGCRATPSGAGCATGGWASSTGCTNVERRDRPRARRRRRCRRPAPTSSIVAHRRALGHGRPQRRDARAAARRRRDRCRTSSRRSRSCVDGKRPPGARVVVYDCDGYFIGAGASPSCCGCEGHDVCIATPADARRRVLRRDARGRPAAPAPARPRRRDGRRARRARGARGRRARPDDVRRGASRCPPTASCW